jgi:hypothetical protein
MFMAGTSCCLLKVNPDIRDAAHSVKVKAIVLHREQLAEIIQLETQSLGRSDTALRQSADSMLW